MTKWIDADDLLSFIDRLKNSGMGKHKSLEFITKYICNISNRINIETILLEIQNNCLNNVESIATMDDTESFKTLGYMCGINEMTNEIINFLQTKKLGGK